MICFISVGVMTRVQVMRNTQRSSNWQKLNGIGFGHGCWVIFLFWFFVKYFGRQNGIVMAILQQVFSHFKYLFYFQKDGVLGFWGCDVDIIRG